METLKIVGLAQVLALVLAAQGRAAPSGAQLCEEQKLRAEAKYAGCRLVADAGYAARGDAVKRDIAYIKCSQKLAAAYGKVEEKYPGVCPTTHDQHAVERFLQSCSEKARDWTGARLASPLVFERLAASGQTTCWTGGNSSSSPLPTVCAGTGQDGELRKGAALAFVDNGDGTITDENTGLQWEKKSDDDSLHDKDNSYPWIGTCSDHQFGEGWCQRDGDCVVFGGTCTGTTIFEWIDELNAAHFAGHDDWRIPNLRELASLSDYSTGFPDPALTAEFNTDCGPHSYGNPGCTVTTCSCTGIDLYWSSTTLAIASGGYAENAWGLYYGYGYHYYDDKSASHHVRAVRGGA
ncbi:MAG TPA: DUF1566 domain-containing protein [Candidatus Binatia bacterium]|nr:DUF1566 domain-containing protein [Candidatus Binatia bacterium]